MKFVVTQIYPCSKVELGSELFYLCELGKYLQKEGHVLSFDGLVLDPCLSKSRYWSYLQVAYTNGWVVDIPNYNPSQSPVILSNVKNIMITEDEIIYDEVDAEKRKVDKEYNSYTPLSKRVVFASKDDSVWSFGKCESTIDNTNNIINLKDDLVSQSWVSLIAYVMIHRLLTEVPQKFTLSLSLEYTMCSLSFADVTLLESETDALNGWCFTDVGEDLRLSYEGWWFKYSEMNYLNRYYTPKEKFLEFKKLGFYKGDVVFLYTREKCQQMNKIKAVADCTYAIIRDVNKEGVSLDKFYTLNTKYGLTKKFNNYPQSLKDMYVDNSYSNCVHTREVISWINLGVEYFLYDEEFFISSICKDDTLTIEDIDDSFKEHKLTLNCPDAIYWLFKDHEVEFNEEKYLNKYFNNLKPMYTLFKEGKL